MAGILDFYGYDSGINDIVSQKQQQANIDNAQDEKIKELEQGGGYPPEGGIPATDLASSVQSSLSKADTAYQKPSGGVPVSDLDLSYPKVNITGNVTLEWGKFYYTNNAPAQIITITLPRGNGGDVHKPGASIELILKIGDYFPTFSSINPIVYANDFFFQANKMYEVSILSTGSEWVIAGAELS